MAQRQDFEGEIVPTSEERKRVCQNDLLQVHILYYGFDLDPTGEAMANTLIARHPTVQRLTRKDWNDVLRFGP